VATTLAATALEVSRVWARGWRRCQTEPGDLLHAAEETVSETAAVARAGNREVSTCEKALFNLACSRPPPVWFFPQREPGSPGAFCLEASDRWSKAGQLGRRSRGYAAAGRTRSAASVQIISSRPGPTPTITTGIPRKSLMNSR
jgi:hypothetical protein